VNKIILASASPRRKELLEKAGIDFIVDASSIDEIMDEKLPIEERISKLAVDKARPIHEKYPYDIVIGADTIVYHDQKIIGKAKNKQEAACILRSLSNDKHSVYTGVAVFIQNRLVFFCEKTDVYFKDINDKIEDYLLSDEWIGKAGAYAIQGIANQFVDYVDGDLENVIGLPVTSLVELFKKYNVKI